MKVEAIGKETIKPSSPTPNDLRTVKLSVYDQFLPPVYTVSVLFFSNSCRHDQTQREGPMFSEHDTSLKLKSSLSETLTRFYPLSGRINDGGDAIDCNDEGAVFVDARSDSTLLDFLKSPDFAALQRFLPLDTVENPYESAATWPLLLVKATYFKCGGLAIGICISHKIADAASISMFVRGWAATARGDSDSATYPEFTAAKFFPPASESTRFSGKITLDRKICATKRFVFDGSKIAELRRKVASGDVAEPTRVESITGLLWKCVVTASNSVSEKLLSKVLNQPVNLRGKVPSLLSENVMGNVMYSSMPLMIDGQGEVEIQDAVKDLRRKADELKRFIRDDGGSSLIGTKMVDLILSNISGLSYETHEPYSVSSWCKLPLYEADFGWGSPAWVTGNVAPALDNLMILIDSKDGAGVEAWVTLPEQVMLSFEQNAELLAFACPNPTVSV
ncbi:PREDICTED: BAHD acyltransferase At5g47980-like [Tarenaya hassleriana]|uniref:BAHD acyltransferase At5g47980-like n=1 Tax=Tarenaya hassleriana TaxID=28532 RepID=UPI00053C8382|nr:PREDICTED: BAHD acyltransferase At5g47980-like [Tarenaya hassleriana]